jgi:hypothetical protein
MLTSLKFNKGLLRKRRKLQEIRDFYSASRFKSQILSEEQLKMRKEEKIRRESLRKKRKFIGTVIAIGIGVLLIVALFRL